jgi:hypothetical protein
MIYETVTGIANQDGGVADNNLRRDAPETQEVSKKPNDWKTGSIQPKITASCQGSFQQGSVLCLKESKRSTNDSKQHETIFVKFRVTSWIVFLKRRVDFFLQAPTWETRSDLISTVASARCVADLN